MGFVKRVREGTVELEDYDNAELEVVRCIGTGLFMVRVDHLEPGFFIKNLNTSAKVKGMLIDPPETESVQRRVKSL